MSISIQLQHGAQKYQIDTSPRTTVGELKHTIEKLTGVPADVQKLAVNSHLLKKDSWTLEEANLKKKCKMILVGNRPDSREQKHREEEEEGEADAVKHEDHQQQQKEKKKAPESKGPQLSEAEQKQHRVAMEIWGLKLNPALPPDELQKLMQRVGDYAESVGGQLDAMEGGGGAPSGPQRDKFLKESREVLTNKIIMLDSLTSDCVTPPVLASKRALLKALIAMCDRIDGVLKA